MVDHKSFLVEYNVYSDIQELDSNDQLLLQEARNITQQAYAPYSGFNVGSVARMGNGQWVRGTNQENASYPIGLCAERVMLAAISSVCPDQAAEVVAISYFSHALPSNTPVAPCGMCRQSLVEFESRFSNPLRILMSGFTGQVFEITSASLLLPFAFKKENLLGGL
jgi:cytidine deaminase